MIMYAWVPTLIYSLCLLASAACATLLVRGYLRSRTALLLYSAACFVFLSVNNLLVVIDLLVFPTGFDLGVIRLLATLAGVSTLIYGFIWEVD
jgi:hypothetical protein